MYGTQAAGACAMLVSLLAGIIGPHGNFLRVFIFVTLGGLIGALFESLLGATVQAIYHCPQCDKETEKYPLHSCGTPTEQVRGWKWLSNDIVNLSCALIGAAVGIVL